MKDIAVTVAEVVEFSDVKRFYDSRGYDGAAVLPSDFIVLAKHQAGIVGVGRLCQEEGMLWLRGMQVEPEFQRGGVGTRILNELSQEIGSRWCCCLPYSHLVSFYGQAGFAPVASGLPPVLNSRLSSYQARGLQVVAMVRPAQSRPNNAFKPKPLRGSA